MMKFLSYLLCLTVLVLSACSGNNQKTFSEEELNLIPKPTELNLKEGSFNFTKETILVSEVFI